MLGLIISVIFVSLLLSMMVEVFSYVMDFENFKDIASLSSRVAVNTVTQAGIQREQNETSQDYYNNKVIHATNGTGVAQVQDGFIAIPDSVFVTGKFGNSYLPKNLRYDYQLKMNMQTLIVGMGKQDGEPRYTADDLKDSNFTMEKVSTVAGEDANDPYKKGNTTVRYTVTMTYKPRIPFSKHIIPILSGGIPLKVTVQPINYIEP